MIWDVEGVASSDELWKMALRYLAVELASERAVILLEEGSAFQAVAHRQLNPDRIWDGSQLDPNLLKKVRETGEGLTAHGWGRTVICSPMGDAVGSTGLVYADRPLTEEEFSRQELDQLQGFLTSVCERWRSFQAPPEPVPEPPKIEEAPVLLPPPSRLGAPIRRGAAPPPEEAPATRMTGTRTLVRPDLVAGRFWLGEPILHCRFSTLYEASDRLSNSNVVLRKLVGDPDSSAGPKASREARGQMLREGRHLSRLVHRNLPRVLEVLEDKGEVFLVIEELSGGTLQKVVESEPGGVAGELLERYLEQFLDVLGFLHTQDPPIIHRDLRPDSILVTTHGVLKLAEFGLARMRESRVDPRETSFRAQGSAYYAPAEQLLGEPSHPHNDLYAAGSILYSLATGKVPVKSVERYTGQAKLEPIAGLRPDLSPALIHVIDRLMDIDTEVRPASVEATRVLWDEAQTGPIARETVEIFDFEPSAEPEPEVTPAPTAERRSVPVVSRPQPQPQPRERKKSALGAIAQKFGAWNFLLGRKQAKDAPVILEEDDDTAGIIEFHSDLASGGEVDLPHVNVTIPVGRLLTETVAKAIQGVCIEQGSLNEITVAVKDPTEVSIYDHISVSTEGRYKPTLVQAEPRYVDLAIEYVYRSNQFSESIPWHEWLERKAFETEDLQVANPMADVAYGADEITSPIIAAVDKLIKEAISTGASDIHLETYEKGMDVRYRIDGQLHMINHYPVQDASAMVKRLKVMANMDIAQERITQGGRISLKVGGQELDLRVSIVPVPAGESVVMRLLKKGAFHLTLRDLGFSDHNMEQFGRILAQPYGMILVCGPTGSGKSTTLYASLKQIQRPDRKLLTVEDPIEYQMPGICQVQVNNAPKDDEQKVSFARVLREFLRQDPDVILVGEIRDTETASIAVQAALTGHLLLSTIHTNDSVGIIARLTDMSVEPFLIGSTLLGGLAQRLARRICQKCREEVKVTDELKKIFEEEGIQVPPRMFHGVGCKSCHQTGHRGRVGLYELLEIDNDVRNLINRRALEEEIRRTVAAAGFRNLYYDGLTKVSEGLVSLEEVQRVCKTI